jgi:hypothetical protein
MNKVLGEKTRKKADLAPELSQEILDVIQIKELVFPKVKQQERIEIKTQIQEIYQEAFKKASLVLEEKVVRDIDDMQKTVI